VVLTPPVEERAAAGRSRHETMPRAAPTPLVEERAAAGRSRHETTSSPEKQAS
jgi:hypothetical protein